MCLRSLSLSHIPLSASPRQSPFVSLHLNTVIFPVSPPSCLSLFLALSSFTSTVLIVRIEIRLIMCRRVDSPGLIAPLLFHVKESERFDEGAGERTRDRLNTSKAGKVRTVKMGWWVYSNTCLAFHHHGPGQYS